MSKYKNQIKIPVTVGLDELFDLITQDKPNWKLVRERDELTKHSVDVMWMEFKEDGTFKAKHKEPAIGRSLIMSPFNHYFTWQTTLVTEIIEQKEDYIKFKTENSNYELFEMINQNKDDDLEL
tara:strand:- start:222 stop:590 length:369 start_codon:yes stop_codon:yes gene_type:complete